jgi:RNA polymerase sigma-70 factor (ECF subfamily)
MPTLSPEDHFLRFRDGGDRDALGALFEIAAPKLAMLASRWCRDGHLVDDLVQETFLRAIRRAESYDASRPLLAWLFGIMRRVACEQFRSRIRQQAAEVDPTTTRGEDLAQAEETMLAVVEAVQNVPSAYRELLQRRVLQGQRAVDIAAELQLPIATVRSKLQRGLRLLRRVLPYGLAGSVFSAFAPAALAAAWHRLLRAADRPTRGPWHRRWSWTAGVATVAVVGSAAVGLALFRTDAVDLSEPQAAAVVTVAAEEHEPTGPLERLATTPVVRVTGRIDFGGEVPAPGATVTALPAPTDCVLPMGPGLVLQPEMLALVQAAARTTGKPLATATVARDGQFALDLPARRALLFVSHTHAGLVLPHLLHTPRDAELHDVGMLTGYVGRCVQGRVPTDLGITTVSVRGGGETYDPFDVSMLLQAMHGMAITCAVAEDGRFTAPSVWPRGRLLVTGAARDGTLWWSHVTGAEPRANAFQRACCNLRVRVTDAAESLPGIVTVRHVSGHAVEAPLHSGVTAFADLLPGCHHVEFRGDDGSLLLGAVDTHDRHELVLCAGGRDRVSGRVLTAAGGPAAAAQVLAIDPRQPATAGPTAMATTDADGRFCLRAPAGSHLVVDGGHGCIVAAAPASPRTVELRLPPLRELCGAMPALAADPELSMLAMLLPSSPPPTRHGAAAAPVLLGPVRRTPAGFGVRAPARNGQLLLLTADRRRALIPVATESLDLGEISLQAPRQLAGTVSDALGRTIADALVVVQVAGMQASSTTRLAACRTDADGRFACCVARVHGLELVATGPNFGRGRRALDRCVDGDLTLVLEPTGTLHGWVLAADTEAGCVLVATGEELLTVSPDAQGRFELPVLPVGSHRVTYTTPDGSDPLHATVTIRAHEITECRLAANEGVAITIHLPSGYLVPAGAWLFIRPADESHPPLQRPLADGIRLELRPGLWWIECLDASGGPLGFAMPLDIPADHRAARSVQLPLATTDLCGEVTGSFAKPVVVTALRLDGSGGVASTSTDLTGRFCLPAVGGEVALFASTTDESPSFAVARSNDSTGAQLQLRPAAWLELPADGSRQEVALLHLDDVPLPMHHQALPSGITNVPVPSGRLRVRIDGCEHTLITSPGQRMRFH